MNYKDKFYSKYVSAHTRQLYGEASLDNIKKQFPAWQAYFGRFLPKDKNVKILDLGCGNGGLVYWLQQIGYQNTEGIDISEEQIEVARGLGIKNISQDDIKSFLKGKNDFYETVFMRDVLEHLTKDEIIETLGLIRESLKSNGMLIIQTSNAESYLGGRIRYADFTHEISFTQISVRQILSFCGYNNISVFPMPPVAHGVVSLVRLVLWKFVEWRYKLQLLVETGSSEGIFTQNLIAGAQK